MATGTVTMQTYLSPDPVQIVSDLNTFFNGRRLRIFNVIRNAAKASTGDVNTIEIRMLQEEVNVGGHEFVAEVFQGSISAVVSAYEALFADTTLVPKYIVDLTEFDTTSVQTIILLVIYLDEDDNPAEGHVPNQLMLARPVGVIAAGGTGVIEYLDAAGNVLGTVTARNVDPATATTADEVGYAVMDQNSNEILFLPSCCGAP